jgi:DNA repair exonuclease SbcCD ATPase subunit
MGLVRLSEVYGKGFRRFVEPFRLKLPESGLALIAGVNRDTGDSSDSGKSTLVLAISYLFGGCPYPATELQSWHTQEPMMVGAVLDTDVGQFTVERSPGLVIKPPKGRAVRGNAAAALLDTVFGMDAKLRALTTYRGQGEDGRFLSMSDEDKKKNLTRALGLDRYERVAAEAAEKAKQLNDKVNTAAGVASAARAALAMAEAAVTPAAEVGDPDSNEQEAVRRQASADALRKQAQEVLAAAEAAYGVAVKKADQATEGFRSKERAIHARPESEELAALRVKLETVRERLKKVQAKDAVDKAALERRRSDIRVAAATAAAGARGLAAAETNHRDALRQVEALLTSTCPTCEQSWTSPECAAELQNAEHAVLAAETAVAAAKRATSELEALRAELGAVPEFEPHPFGPRLSGAEQQLVVAVRDMAQKEQRASAAALEVLVAEERAARERLLAVAFGARAAEKAVAATLEQRAQGEQDAARRFLASAAQQRAVVAVREERLRAVATARATAEKAAAEHADVERQARAELDLHALVGRNGFLGVIFDDVLAEIAAATNDILSRVANVRHVTFEFDPDPDKKRITPMVRIDGESRPMASGLSGGQASAVKLAVDLGVGEVAAKRRGSYPGWLVLDESFNGLGRVSKETCMEMLGAYAGDRLILCIDHSTEFTGLFSQVIHVESIDGRSRLV